MNIKSPKKYCIFPFLLIVILIGCKKDKLTGDFSPLIGKWCWVMKTGGISGQTTYSSTSNERVIEFLEKGKYTIYKNGNKDGKGWTLYEDDHVVFKPTGFEKAQDGLTFKKFYPGNIIGDSLYLTNTKFASNLIDSYVDIYVRQ